MKISTNNHSAAEERRIRAAEFDWDLAVQLSALREERGLTQAQLAERVGTHQQAISRLENPAYGRQSLSTLRQVASALGAFVDVAIVPDEKLEAYCEKRYIPLLEEEQGPQEGASDREQSELVVDDGRYRFIEFPDPKVNSPQRQQMARRNVGTPARLTNQKRSA